MKRMSLGVVQTLLPEVATHADGADAPPLRAVVIPAPTADGVVPTAHGRRHKMSDPAALAARFNAQPVGVRIDYDHQSEPSSPTYHHSSAAHGWARDFRVTANGAVDALLELSTTALEALRQRAYRYLSPAVLLDADTSEIDALSSVALVNNPLMILTAPEVHSDMNDDTAESAEQLAARAAKIDTREAALNARLEAAAKAAVEQAITDQRLLPAQRAFALNGITSHPDGIEAGITAFDAAYASDVGSTPLETRIGPRGAPDKTASHPAFAPPAGHQVDEERLAFHSAVAKHARTRGISYREAVAELGAVMG